METKAEDSIHFLRLKLNKGATTDRPKQKPRETKSMENFNDAGRSTNPQPFDGISARRKIFNEMSSSSMTIRPQNYQPNYQQNYQQNYQSNYQPNMNNNYSANPGNMFTGSIDARMTPVSNPAMGTAAFNETIVSSNVEDLIDVMAKRRLAIKNLENEMNRQHSRGSNLVKSFGPEQSRIDVNTRPPIDVYNSFRERQGYNNPGSYYDPQKSLIGKTPLRNLNDPYQNTHQSNLISNLEYPSDTNREIYSTYLVDSIKPHYSARRLISGKPFPITQNSPTSAYQTKPPDVYKTTSSLPIASNPPPNYQNNNYPVVPNYNQTVPNYNQSNSQPILENYKQQQPVQPIVNNYGPVYNQPVVADSSVDPEHHQMKMLKESVASQTNFDREQPVSNAYTGLKNPSNELRRSDLLESKTENLPNDNIEYSSDKKFDFSTPRENKPKFYLSENQVDQLDTKLTARNSQMKNESFSKNEDDNDYDYALFDSEQKSQSPIAIQNEPQNSSTKLNETYRIKSKIEQKYPKLYDRQKFFWAAATIVKFIVRIKSKSEQTAKLPDRTGSASIFRIRLLEIMTAVHRVYLEPEGPIYTSLINFIRNENDMNALFDIDSLIYSQCIQTLCQNIEETCQRITEFMPKEGIIGTTAKSALLSLISEGNKFPDNYFWDEEKERLKFDENGKIRNINRGRAILILMSALVSRGLITTLLIKPIKFRLLRGEIPTNVKLNLKVFATVMCFIVRRVNNNTDIPLEFPWEWQSSMFNDVRMKPIFQNQDVIVTVEKCRKLFVNWANEYINRLDETAGLTR